MGTREVGRGVRSRVYAYGHDDVAKVPFRDVPAAWLAEELRLTDLAAQAGAPVPCRRRLVDVGGRVALAEAHVTGPTMLELLAADPGRAGELGADLAAIQTQLTRRSPSIALPAQRDRVIAKVHRAAERHGADLRRALDLLPPDDQPLVLCHGDLHPGNVIRSPEGDVLVDWFDASRGTIAGEVARTLVTLRSAERAHRPPLSEALRALADGYLAAAGRWPSATRHGLDDWLVVQAIARLAEGIGEEELPERRRQLATRLADR